MPLQALAESFGQAQAQAQAQAGTEAHGVRGVGADPSLPPAVLLEHVLWAIERLRSTSAGAKTGQLE